MPSFRPDVSEADMWGLTPFDQMWCRREFHKMRYEGHFTPPSVEGTFVFPGNAGGFNWGGVAVDEDNQLLVATPLIMGSRLALIPRDKVPKEVKRYLQLGTPYAADIRMFMSPLQMPCMRPPYGRIAVVDLQTRQVALEQAARHDERERAAGARRSACACRWACRSRRARSSRRAA